MSQINLLPEELKPKRYIVRISAKLRKAAMIFTILFVVVAAIAVGAFLVVQNRYEATNSRQERLKSELQALQQTQQRLVLIQDRIVKIDQVLAVNTVNEEVNSAEFVINTSQGLTSLNEASLTSEDATYKMGTDTSADLTRFLARLISEGEFASIKLVSLSYSLDQGYEFEFVASK